MVKMRYDTSQNCQPVLHMEWHIGVQHSVKVLHSNVPPPFMVFEFFQNHLSSKLIYFTGKGFIIKRFIPKEFLPQYVVR